MLFAFFSQVQEKAKAEKGEEGEGGEGGEEGLECLGFRSSSSFKPSPSSRHMPKNPRPALAHMQCLGGGGGGAVEEALLSIAGRSP